jgi:hypothetical protein
MRRLNRNEDGITVVIVTLGMTVFILIAALALDMGTGFFNRARAQNSADARALAAAINCASGKPIDTTPLPALNSAPAASIAHDQAVALDISSCAGHNEVTATVTQPQDFQFIPGSVTINRDATARWGAVGGANVLPVTIASCEFSQALLDGTADITLYLDDPKPQSGCSSLPGGFSQLQSGDTSCSIEIDANGDVPGKPGGDLKKKVPCITPLPKDVLVPIYDETVLSQVNHDNGQGPYHILGFAMFHVTGYSFNGNAHDGSLGNSCPGRPNNPLFPGAEDPKYCIRGDFIRFLAPGDAIPGPSQDFGVTKVYLTN